MNGSAKVNGSNSFGKHIPRRQCIPILYTKGTHYDVGFDMVRFFHNLFLALLNTMLMIHIDCVSGRREFRNFKFTSSLSTITAINQYNNYK